jgi:hypothetical protein
MGVRRHSWVAHLFLLVVIALVGLPAQDRIIFASSAPPGSEDKAAAKNVIGALVTLPSLSSCPQPPQRSLWVGLTKAVSAITLDSGCATFTIPAEHLEDIAVDNEKSVVWVASRKAIVQYDFSGREILRYALGFGHHRDTQDHETNRHDTARRGQKSGNLADRHDEGRSTSHDEGGSIRPRLSLDPSGGSLWIGAGHDVIKISADGQVLAAKRIPGHVADVSVDIADGACWVGAGGRITRYTSEGDNAVSFPLEKEDKVIALAADPQDHHLWIGSKEDIIKVDGQGIEILRVSLPGQVRDLAVDLTTRELWVVTREAVLLYDREGRQILLRALCPESEEDDAASHAVHRSGQKRTGAAGYSQEQRGGEEETSGLSESRDDNEGCRSGHCENGDRADGFCAGGLVTLAVDPTDKTCWVAGRKSLWKMSKTDEQLLVPKGFKQINALDIGMPKLGITITAPRDGDVLRDEPFTAVTGTVSDPAAKVSVQGRGATVAGLAFEALDVPLSDGTNTITATAANIAGRSASNSVRVQYQPQKNPGFYVCPEPYWEQWPQLPPPDCAQQALLNQWNYSRAYLFGHVEQNTTSVMVDGVALPDGAEIYAQGRVTNGLWSDTFFWVLLRLSGPDGSYPVTASSTDEQGSMKTATVTIYKDTTPPVVAISSPADGMVTRGSTIILTGTVDDPAAKLLFGWAGKEVPVVNGSFSAMYDLEVWDGPQELFVTALDPAMNSGYASVPVIRDSTSPQLSVEIPADGAIVSAPTISISGTMDDMNPDSVTISINGGIHQPLQLSGRTISGIASLVSGANTIHIEARDKAGNAATLSRAIILDNELPAVAITSPLSDAALSGQAAVAVTASDVLTGVQSVALSVDGIQQASKAQEPYQFIVDTLRLAAGSHTITAKATDRAGNTSEASVAIDVQKQLGIELSSPPDGGTIRGSMVIVRGKFDPFANPDVGITVNGIPAQQSGSDFAVAIPLQAGLNTITTVISNEYGVKELTAITVSADGQQEPLRVTANPESGIPMPKADGSTIFETRLQAEASLPGLPVDYAWDLNGDGVADQQGATLTAVSVSFTRPGLYYPSVTVADSVGNTVAGTTVVNVIDRASIDARLQAKWEGMKTRLAERDIEGALSQFIPRSQSRYREIFLSLNDVLPQMVQDMRAIQPIYIREGIAKYRIRKAEMAAGAIEEITYYIYFALDKDGMWKIAYF